jgi:hypothetical protein
VFVTQKASRAVNAALDDGTAQRCIVDSSQPFAKTHCGALLIVVSKYLLKQKSEGVVCYATD